MFSNYIKVAFRNIVRNKLYAAINILGLAMGLTIYIFSGLLVDYEYSHDAFYKNSDRIYTVGSLITPEANAGIDQINSLHPAVTPFIRTELPELEAVARTIVKRFLFTIGEDSYYQNLRFADPELLTIFDFEYVLGDGSALDNPSGMVITESAAKKYFSDKNPIGQTITLDHQNDLTVTAVIKDVPLNTHFNSYFIDNVPLEVIASINIMERTTGLEPDTSWDIR